MTEDELNARVAKHVKWVARHPDHPITMAELARRMGLSRQSLSARLNGRIPWDTADLAKLQNILGVEASDLLRPPDYVLRATATYCDPAVDADVTAAA